MAETNKNLAEQTAVQRFCAAACRRTMSRIIAVRGKRSINVDADFEDNGKIGVRYAQGEYDADSFPEDAQEITVSGKDSAKVDGIEPGSYTVLVTATDDLNGTAVIR